MKAYTTYARNVPAALEQIKANIKTPIAKNLVAIGRQTIGGLADFYDKDVVKVFEPVTDAQSQKDFKTLTLRHQRPSGISTRGSLSRKRPDKIISPSDR